MIKTKFMLVVWAAILLQFLSCSSAHHWKLRLGIPGDAILDLDQYEEIIITNFFIQKETEDIDLSQEIVEYLNAEIGQEFEGKITVKNLSIEDESIFTTAAFWQEKATNPEKTLFLTGSAQYTEEIRKAILDTRRRKYEDPFESEKTLTERRFYTLNLDLYLIHAQTGKPLYTREFKEIQGYKNPNQTAYFAFFDLVQKVKDKLFRSVLGGERIQERYIISK
jgi:hypothetical protein